MDAPTATTCPRWTLAPWTASSARARKRSSTGGDRTVSANTLGVTLAQAIDRYLLAAGVSAATRRAYGSDLRDFARWYGTRPLEEIDIRVLADYTAELGRARP